jgi:predicted  nucleic acid-binding Zn-ribbon protein
MPRKSNSDMIAALEAKLAEARAKEAAKATTRVSYLVEAIKTIDEKIAKADSAFDEAVAKAQALRDGRISKLEEKRADLDAELADLAVESVDASQLTFDEPVEAEEV